MARRIAGVVVAAAIVSVVAGCGGTTEGSPSTSTSAAEAPLFNPCTGIPDDVLRSAGVDPATEESGIAGVHQHGWEICSWSNKQFSMTVFSTGRTVAEFEKKPGNTDFRDVTVAGRKGRQFKVEGASKDVLCDVLFPVSTQGVVQLRISNRIGLDNLEEPCSVLYRVGESIVPILPR
ncbi:DUF3558 domain-containing protein [Nocardia bhagyanarayanae]|uniref:Uncharacterized protein DUF3558 n=1 Tax=Nocardia bhagyanarayanae TaxID=1215925 RepID=A0A543EXJ6_9NOCA|nr:DUF3558 domain-containing protein [Nocardia bhagyanarayanae]TQM26219.1 uncharacterized protein DUF3558 [Nocardia bhagyanarayanae]